VSTAFHYTKLDTIKGVDCADLTVGLIPAYGPYPAIVDLRDADEACIQIALGDVPKLLSALKKAQDAADAMERGDVDG